MQMGRPDAWYVTRSCGRGPGLQQRRQRQGCSIETARGAATGSLQGRLNGDHRCEDPHYMITNNRAYMAV